jgi:hypothetical protein
MREHRIGDHSRLASKERIGSTPNREVGVAAELLSAIRNLVCPECGGPMGGRAKEFQCRGQCGTDWRSVWELVTAGTSSRETSPPAQPISDVFVPLTA